MSDLTAIDTIGETIAESITTYFTQASIQKLVQELIDSGVSTDYLGEDVSEEEIVSSFFENKTVVLTRKLAHFTRSEFTKKLEDLGAKVTSSVSKKTDYVIYGTDVGSKLTRAEGLKIAFLTEEEAIERIQ